MIKDPNAKLWKKVLDPKKLIKKIKNKKEQHTDEDHDA